MHNKWYGQTWLWLILLCCIHLAMFVYTAVDDRQFPQSLSFLLYGTFWTAIGSIGTLISIIVAVTSTVNENTRKKKERTLEAYTQFKESVRSSENRIHNYTKENIHDIIAEHKKGQESNNSDWNIIKEYLAAVERIAVGVNTDIYDASLINRMGGYFMYEQYRKLKPIICYKRCTDNNPNIYKEFTDMVNKIIDIRVKSGQPRLDYVD